MKIGQVVHIKAWHKRTETENLTSMHDTNRSKG